VPKRVGFSLPAPGGEKRFASRHRRREVVSSFGGQKRRKSRSFKDFAA
jgi:hypothetical protein